jgi:AraC-like DNA-binding protein
MTSPHVPPLGLVEHPPRDVLLLESHFPDHPGTLAGYHLRPLEEWDGLRERMRTAPPSSVVLVRSRGEARELAEIGELVRATPSVPTVAALDLGEMDAGRVRAVLAAGVAEIVNLQGVASLEALVPTLRRAHAQPLKRRMEARLPVWLPEDARTLLRAAAETVVDCGARDAFAGIFGVYFRTLSERSADLRVPMPRRLLGWMRVLLALSLLEEAERTVMNVALSCGYNDNSSLKRAVENFTGAPPTGSIRDQRFDPAFDVFVAELRALRHAVPGRRTATSA